MNNLPELNYINETKVFERKKDVEHSEFQLEMFNERFEENENFEVETVSDFTELDYILYNLTNELGVWPMYIGNEYHLILENGEIKLKTKDEFLSMDKFETSIGTVITENHGEWGGNLYIITEYGAEQAGSGNFNQVFEYNNKIYAISSLSHLTLRKSSLHEIRKYEDKFEDTTIFKNFDLTMPAAFIENNILYFYSTAEDSNGLYKYNLDNNNLEFIFKLSYPYWMVNSIIKKENYVYLYGNYLIIKYNLETDDLQRFTQLKEEDLDELYMCDVKLSEIWDKYKIKKISKI